MIGNNIIIFHKFIQVPLEMARYLLPFILCLESFPELDLFFPISSHSLFRYSFYSAVLILTLFFSLNISFPSLLPPVRNLDRTLSIQERGGYLQPICEGNWTSTRYMQSVPYYPNKILLIISSLDDSPNTLSD